MLTKSSAGWTSTVRKPPDLTNIHRNDKHREAWWWLPCFYFPSLHNIHILLHCGLHHCFKSFLVTLRGYHPVPINKGGLLQNIRSDRQWDTWWPSGDFIFSFSGHKELLWLTIIWGIPNNHFVLPNLVDPSELDWILPRFCSIPCIPKMPKGRRSNGLHSRCPNPG